VTDQASDIIIYNVKTNTVTTSPKISTKNRENFPTWSPDGKWLYFISAPETKGDFQSRFYTTYSLVRILYDPRTKTWGDIDTVLSSNKTGKSITFPRISPDGHYLLFCMIDHGYFSINQAASDLYLMDLATRNYHKLGINSPSNESYHCWSRNGRWFVFSSKRYNHVFSYPYFSYFDKNGKAHKPFILPQKDPLFYDSFLNNYNIPELVNGKVSLNPKKIGKLFNEEPVNVQFDPSVDVDALSGATWIDKLPL
jgi:Tol biopolymer transport system component